MIQLNNLQRALLVALGYTLFGMLWFTLGNQASPSFWEPIFDRHTIKALLFVVVSTGVILTLHFFLSMVYQKQHSTSLVDRIQQDNKVVMDVLQRLPMGVAVYADGKQCPFMMNDQFSHILGWEEEDLKKADSLLERIYPDPAYRAHITKRLADDIKSGDPQRMTWNDIRIKTKDNETKIINAQSIPLYNGALMVSTVFDVTDVSRNQDQLDIAIDAAKISTWVLDLHSGHLSVNDYWAKMLGYKLEDIDDKQAFFIRIIHPDDIEAFKSVERLIMGGEEAEFSLELRLKAADGSYRWILDQGRVTKHDHRGKPLELAGIHLDVTDKKRLESELSSFFDLSADTLCIGNVQGKFTKVNPALPKLLGYSEEEILSSDIIDYVHPEDRYATTEALENLAKGGTLNNFENRYLTKQGQVLWLNWSSSAANDSGHFYAVAKDCTERMLHLNALKEQNERLLEISWSQSHLFRAPLARIKSLIGFAHEDQMNDLRFERFLSLLRESADELDELIHRVNTKSEVQFPHAHRPSILKAIATG